MRIIVLTLLLSTFCLPPVTLLAQRLTINPTEVTMTEGDYRDFTVALSSEPTGDVTVTIAVHDGAAISLDRTELTFTPLNWNQPQKIRMTAEQDMDISDNEGAVILIASGGGYDGDGVIISPKTAVLRSPGETVQLNATVPDQDGEPVTGISLEWSSTDPSVAVVDSAGEVTAVNSGKTTVTAAFATASGTATISVTNNPSTFSDREILEMLFKATGGEKWTRRDKWLTDAPLGEWYGVQTNAEGYVTNVTLVVNNLTGRLPSSLGSLINLEKLLLHSNSLTGPIPPELGNLTQLENLNLDFNSLTGPIPPELGNLTQLESLGFGRNSLDGQIPPELGNLTQLEELKLYSNSITGLIVPELGKLTRLKYLNLGGNDLTGPIPSELGKLAQLLELRLYNNDLTGPIPPELGDLTQLLELRLYNNDLTGPIPPELGKLAQLLELRLYNNDLTGPIPPELGKLTQLLELRLYNNDLTGPLPSELGNLAQLKTMSLSFNSLTGQIPPELGNLVQLNNLILLSNSLTGQIPPELGNLAQLEALWLDKNSLTGPIPPELGNLAQLELLDLRNNDLSGSVPPELGNLTQLETLWLYNNDLEGLLPRSLLGLNLGSLDVRATRICRQQDTVFLEWWNNIPYSRAVDCTSAEIERLALIELYNKMNGPSWANAMGWGGDGSLEEWHGVTVENGHVTGLSLPNNLLKNSISGEIANFIELEALNLAENSLTGTLPEEITSLSNLTELRVNDNTDIEGALSYDLMNLSKLEVLHFQRTSLCASPASTFQTWYTGIGDTNGMLCGNPANIRLDIPVAYLTQSVQTQQGSVRLIEGRDALLRVFVTGTPEPAFFEYEVVATVRGGGRTHRVEMTRAGDRFVAAADESDLDNSFNAMIPGHLIVPGATLVVEADPDGVVPRAAGSQDRFPVTGEKPLNVISVPNMEVTVVPVLEANQPDQSIFEWTNNIGDNSPEVGLLKYAFPFHGFHAKSRESYVTSLNLTSGAGQWSLVLELEALRLLDKATGYYYGAAASVNGFVRGIAQIGGWTSMGKAWDTEFAHEIGHNLNLRHAPCGDATGSDPDFPYSNGSVGAWGFDFRDSTLVSPRYHKDIMGYCYEQGWLSDYYFEKVIDYREQIGGKSGRPIAGAVQESNVLILWGGVQEGELRIEPPFLVNAPAQLPETDGPYRLEGFGLDTVLFSLSFTPGEDKFGNKYFFFALPVEQEWKESLERIVLAGPEESVIINANDQHALSIFRDVYTGQVRGILRDWNGDIPAALEDVDNLSIDTIQGLTDSVSQQR